MFEQYGRPRLAFEHDTSIEKLRKIYNSRFRKETGEFFLEWLERKVIEDEILCTGTDEDGIMYFDISRLGVQDG